MSSTIKSVSHVARSHFHVIRREGADGFKVFATTLVDDYAKDCLTKSLT